MAGNTQIKLRQILQDGATNNSNVIRWNTTEWIAAILDSTAISDFNEAAQDAVGLMVDANSLVYTDATPLLAVKQQMSITSDASGVKLSGDTASPGNNKIYGTNGSGTKGWFDSPSGADGNGIYTGSGTIGAGVGGSFTTATLPTGSSGFAIKNSGAGSNAIEINNNSSLQLNSPTVGKSYIQFFDTSLIFGFDANIVELDLDRFYTSVPQFIDIAGTVTIDPKAALDVNATNKAFLLPRLSGAQFTTFDGLNGGVTTDGMMLYNTSTDTIKVRANGAWIDLAAAGGGLITASNGLTATGTNVKLGGALIDATTTITGDATNYLIITGARTVSTNASLHVNNTGASGSAIKTLASGTGAGVWGESTTGTGVYGTSAGPGLGSYTTGTVATYSQIETSGTTDVLTTLKLDRLTTNTAGNGLGSKILFTNETSTTPLTEANSIVSKWSNAIHAARLAEFSITGYNIGTENTLLTLLGTGAARLNQYGASGFTGTPTRTLQVDSSGNIIQNSTVTLGNGIYGGSGDIQNNTVATLVTGGDFTIDYFGGTDAIRVDDSTSSVYLQSKNGTADFSVTNTGILSTFSTANTLSEVLATQVRLAYDDGGSAPQQFIVDSTGAYMTSTTKMLRPPSMTTAQRTGGTLTETGGFVYDTTLNKMYFRDNSTFIEIANGAAGFGGIYKGSGTIAPATAATVTANSTFVIYYSNLTDAIGISDSGTGLLAIKNRAGNKAIILDDTKIELVSSGGSIAYKIDNNGLTGTSSPILIDYTGLGASNHSGLELRATDKLFYTSRMSTAERDALTPTTGAIVYNNTTNKFNFWETAWVQYMVDAAGVGGIYKGSGTIASGATATTTTNSFFKFEFAGGNDAFILDSTTGSERLDIRGKSTAGDYATAIFNLTELRLAFGGAGEGIVINSTSTTLDSNKTTIAKASYRTGTVTPALITSNQNDYALGDSGEATYVRVSSDAARDITGIAGGVAGREIVLINIGTQNIILKSDSASSSPTNRMLMRNATDTTLLPAQCVTLWYDDPGSNARWRVTSGA